MAFQVDAYLKGEDGADLGGMAGKQADCLKKSKFS